MAGQGATLCPMQLPNGFLGTDADVLMDVIIVALPVVLGVMTWAIYKARARQWTTHRNTQVGLAALLFVVVTALEIDIHYMAGDVLELGASSRIDAETLRLILDVHLVFSTSTAILWVGLIVWSLKRFGSPPTPSASSAKHRFWGRVAAVDMALTAITGLGFYVACFMMTG